MLQTQGTVVKSRPARFVTRAVIGNGWLGTVYRARDHSSGQDVVVKVLRPDLFHANESRNLLVAAGRQAQRLCHPGLLPILQSDPTGAYPWFASELSEGLSLRRSMEKRAEKNQPYTMAEVTRLVATIADALDVLYRGLPGHGLLKPENLFILPGFVRTSDYHLGASLPIRVLAAARDQRYLAPEVQILVPLSPASDVFSLGWIVLEMLQGAAALEGRRLGLVRPDLPAGLDLLLRRCVSEDPSARPRTPRELADRLEALTERSTTTGAAPSVVPISQGHDRRP